MEVGKRDGRLDGGKEIRYLLFFPFFSLACKYDCRVSIYDSVFR